MWQSFLKITGFLVECTFKCISGKCTNLSFKKGKQRNSYKDALLKVMFQVCRQCKLAGAAIGHGFCPFVTPWLSL